MGLSEVENAGDCLSRFISVVTIKIFEDQSCSSIAQHIYLQKRPDYRNLAEINRITQESNQCYREKNIRTTNEFPKDDRRLNIAYISSNVKINSQIINI